MASFALAAVLAGCTPSIGDKCVLSTDCSTRGDRLCDTSQPGGYCTQFNCADFSCPDHASCVLFDESTPGCSYNDRSGAYGSRTGRSFCVAVCVTDKDCRDGYVCADPHASPWNAIVLDDDQSRRTCLVPPFGYVAGQDAGIMSAPDPLVCSASPPPVAAIVASPALDGGATPPLLSDASAPDAADAGDAGDGGDGG